MGLRERIATLLGISTYSAPPPSLPGIDDEQVDRVRRALGGQLQTQPYTRTRWYLADLEAAQHAADGGDLSQAAQLCRAMRSDPFLAGLLSTRTSGLVHLPKRFSGNAEIAAALEGRDGARSVFDDMFPPAELALMEADGLLLGVAVGELLPVPGRDFPVLSRLDPEWLVYRWNENRWYYRSVAGLIPITPGDGRWVLHTPGGRVAPWQNGLWRALGRAYINKEHAILHSANWEGKLANPARAAYAPAAATELQRFGFLQRLIAWGINTVFELPPGWDVKIIESNGRGWESFDETIRRSDREYMVALAGQVVTTDGGAGFANANIHQSIRADLITASAESLAYTINTQGTPAWIADRWGLEALENPAIVTWDSTPPKDLKANAEAIKGLGEAINLANTALAAYGKRVDGVELAIRYGVPIQDIEPQTSVPANDPEPDLARDDELGAEIIPIDVDETELEEAA
jgi:hypothetical protein